MGAALLMPFLIIFSNYIALAEISEESKTAYFVFLAIIIVLWILSQVFGS